MANPFTNTQRFQLGQMGVPDDVVARVAGPPQAPAQTPWYQGLFGGGGTPAAVPAQAGGGAPVSAQAQGQRKIDRPQVNMSRVPEEMQPAFARRIQLLNEGDIDYRVEDADPGLMSRWGRSLLMGRHYTEPIPNIVLNEEVPVNDPRLAKMSERERELLVSGAYVTPDIRTVGDAIVSGDEMDPTSYKAIYQGARNITPGTGVIPGGAPGQAVQFPAGAPTAELSANTRQVALDPKTNTWSYTGLSGRPVDQRPPAKLLGPEGLVAISPTDVRGYAAAESPHLTWEPWQTAMPKLTSGTHRRMTPEVRQSLEREEGKIQKIGDLENVLQEGAVLYNQLQKWETEQGKGVAGVTTGIAGSVATGTEFIDGMIPGAGAAFQGVVSGSEVTPEELTAMRDNVLGFVLLGRDKLVGDKDARAEASVLDRLHKRSGTQWYAGSTGKQKIVVEVAEQTIRAHLKMKGQGAFSDDQGQMLSGLDLALSVYTHLAAYYPDEVAMEVLQKTLPREAKLLTEAVQEVADKQKAKE